MTDVLPEPGRRVTELWTFVAVDPFARPLSERLAARSAVTPNRVTTVALALGVAAAACFATGLLRAGGVLFVLRFFVDCLDGRVARLQGTSSARGAFLDLASDVVGVTAAFAALGWYLLDAGHLSLPVLAGPPGRARALQLGARAAQGARRARRPRHRRLAAPVGRRPRTGRAVARALRAARRLRGAVGGGGRDRHAGPGAAAAPRPVAGARARRRARVLRGRGSAERPSCVAHRHAARSS